MSTPSVRNFSIPNQQAFATFRRMSLSSLAGAPFNERNRQIEAEAFAQQARDQMGVDGLTRPVATADVTRIGAGSGWNAPKPTIASGAKALLLNRLAKATSRPPLTPRF